MRNRISLMCGMLMILLTVGVFTFSISSNASPKEMEQDFDPDIYLKRIWLVDGWMGGGDYPVSFVFTKLENGLAEGYIRLGDSLSSDYFDFDNRSKFLTEFGGVVDGNRAECSFTSDKYGDQRIRFLFANGRIDAVLDYDRQDIAESYLCRPKNLKDYGFVKDVASVEVELDSWGMVRLTALAYGGKEDNFGPLAVLIDDEDNILYEFWPVDPGGWNVRVFDVLVEDMNRDGLKDVKVITGFLEDTQYEYRFVRNFYQKENGMFSKEMNSGGWEKTEKYNGYYRCTEFCSMPFYQLDSKDIMTEQEADMMLGRIFALGDEEQLVYDCERRQGIPGKRDVFYGNHMIQQNYYISAQRWWKTAAPGTLMSDVNPDIAIMWAVGWKRYSKINGIMYDEHHETIRYYTMKGTEDLIMESSLTGQYFMLEKLEGEEAEEAAEQMAGWEEHIKDIGEDEKESILQEVYGSYTVKEFLPTRYYDTVDDEILSYAEAEMMQGKEIIIGQDAFVTYDNFRWAGINIGESEEGLQEVTVSDPDYHLADRYRWEIFGLRDEMLPEELVQGEYMEIDVYPGYDSGDRRYLPQLFLTEDGKILMYAMGQYFVLEKKDR